MLFRSLISLGLAWGTVLIPLSVWGAGAGDSQSLAVQNTEQKTPEVLTDAQKEAIQLIVRQEMRNVLRVWTRQNLRSLINQTVTENLSGMQSVISEALTIARQNSERTLRQQEGLKSEHKALFQNTAHPFLGNPSAQNRAVLFADPYCGHCHDTLEAFEQYTEKNPQTHVIIMNYPLFGRDSHHAVTALLAAHLQKKYKPYLKAFLKKFKDGKMQPLNIPALKEVARSLRMDVAQFDKDRSSPAIEKWIKTIRTLGKTLQISGTPTLVIAGIPGKTESRLIEGVTRPEEVFLPPQ